MGTRLTTTLRAARTGRHLSQEALAALAGISRQSYSAIESGAAVPSTEVALRLARALSLGVEALFRLPESPPRTVEAAWGSEPPAGSSRVRLARVAGRVHAYPLRAVRAAGMLAADGVATRGAQGEARVALFEELPAPPDLVAAGCDPSFALVADALGRERGVEVLSLQQTSRASLQALAEGRAHLAGIHFSDRGRGSANARWVRRVVPFPCTRISFAIWQQDLLLAPGNPLGLESLQDLIRPDVRFLNRPPGSGSRSLLEARLKEAGVPVAAIPGYDRAHASGHLAVAEAIASGSADAGVAIHAAGLARGLDRLPLGEERYDLVVPDHFLDLPAIQALLELLRGRALRTQVEALGGYDAAAMGLSA